MCAKERTRPIIFVVHSLGGLVAREAMIELNRHLNLYPGLDLRYCGLLFLATPHSGVVLADWNPYLVQFSELMGIRGRELTQILQAFNKGSHVSKQDFKRLPYPVPYECLHETIKTKVGLRKKLVCTVCCLLFFLIPSDYRMTPAFDGSSKSPEKENGNVKTNL